MRDDGTPTPGYRDWRGALETIRPVRAQRQMGLGLRRRAAVGQDVLPGLQSLAATAPTSIRSRPAATEGVSQLYAHRPRRSQLLRRARHLLLRLLGIRRAAAASGHPSGHRLQLHVRQSDPRRRARLQRQPHQPQPRPGLVRSDHRQRRQHLVLCGPTTADPTAKIPSNCLLRGIPGTYTRVSAEVTWKQQHHRSDRPDLHAVPVAARRRRRVHR